MTITIHQLLQTARNRIQPVSDSAAYDAQVLLASVLGVDRAYLLAHPSRTLTPDQQTQFEALVHRCAEGEPLAYILGRRAFYDRDLFVSPDVLVPRPETELLLERALTFARQRPTLTAVDVGTGSGALAVTFAAHCPAATVYATDISLAALAVARQNAAQYQAQVQFFEGDLLTPLLEQAIRLDLIMANLPYIPSRTVDELPVSRHEPRLEQKTRHRNGRHSFASKFDANIKSERGSRFGSPFASLLARSIISASFNSRVGYIPVLS